MDMSEMDLIAKLAEAIEKLQRPAIPLSVDLWDLEMIALYLKRDQSTVRDRISCLPSFPKAIRIPTSRGRGRPLYNAKQVIAWVESFRDKN